MDKIEKKLSSYIDALNAEKKPKEHNEIKHNEKEYPDDLEELMNTVRLVRSIKEPAYPNEDYSKKLSASLTSSWENSNRNSRKHSGRRWIPAIAAIAAILAFAFIYKYVLPGNHNVVYAMEQAIKEVKAYHGTIQVTEINELGEETTQAVREVWTNQEGNYYLKEIKGTEAGVTTVNNGKQKWQIRPNQKEVYLYNPFPDSYQFTFELGNEVEYVKNALEVKKIGEEKISGRKTTVFEVLPKGGNAYKLWVDQETELPLQRQTAMEYGIQYTITYTEIEFTDSVPDKVLAYEVPKDYAVINNNQEQLVNNLKEAEEMAGFTAASLETIPKGYSLSSIAADTNGNTIKRYYQTINKKNTVIITQRKADSNLIPDSNALIGTVNNKIAEILSSVESNNGTLTNGGAYAGMTDIASIRWQENGFEFQVLGNVNINEIKVFAEALTKGDVLFPSEATTQKPKVEVKVDLEAEENEQKSVDAGHSPWKLDPAFVAQVFASLLIHPEGIQGDYPIPYEDIKITKNNGTDAIAEIATKDSPVSRVYLKRLVRQDSTGIWTVVGYDPVK